MIHLDKRDNSLWFNLFFRLFLKKNSWWYPEINITFSLELPPFDKVTVYKIIITFSLRLLHKDRWKKKLEINQRDKFRQQYLFCRYRSQRRPAIGWLPWTRYPDWTYWSSGTARKRTCRFYLWRGNPIYTALVTQGIHCINTVLRCYMISLQEFRLYSILQMILLLYHLNSNIFL